MCMASLEAEVASLRRSHCALVPHFFLRSSLQTLRRAVSNLRDIAFDAKDDGPNIKLKGKVTANEESNGDPNASDDHSDATNDASDGSSPGDDGKNEVDDANFDVFNHVDSD